MPIKTVVKSSFLVQILMIIMEPESDSQRFLRYIYFSFEAIFWAVTSVIQTRTTTTLVISWLTWPLAAVKTILLFSPVLQPLF